MRRPPAPTDYTPVEPGEPVEVGHLFRPKYDPYNTGWKSVEASMLPNVFFTSRLHTDLWFCKPKEASRA